jgi:hypothetical protein
MFTVLQPENQNRTDQFGDSGVHRIILKWIVQNRGRSYELDLNGSGYGTMAGFCRNGSEPSGFIKCRKRIHAEFIFSKLYRIIQKEVYTFKILFYKNC